MHPLGLQFPPSGNLSETKQKAINDARAAQSIILKECADAQREPPPYQLLELIGKGSFGRVYKASASKSSQLVAVKIISIEEGDKLGGPGTADTLGDIIKEVHTLKLLSDSKAKNVNVVVESLLVGQSVWVVTEYCAGGSVASLMRPTSGLAERWIIPILREAAEALYWVHKQGIIHRDIKCANVLVTEAGSVQLCDFGVAGIIETKFDKRSTVTGTLHWMAPELFDSNVSYGIEVDIWAFGSMAFEMANGLPPNATARIQIQEFGSYLKQNRPRLQGDKFSDQLKHLISFCLVEDPKLRPTIEAIQGHPYICNTEDRYPTVVLAKLVADYKRWESQGGSRKSLFSAGGAQSPSVDPTPTRQSVWDFGDYDESEELTLQAPDKAQLFTHHASASNPETTMQPAHQIRRRRPPPNLSKLKGPLEKVFDPNTITNYEDNSRAWYGRMMMPPPAETPPRKESPKKEPEQTSVRESLIDLDLAMDGDVMSPPVDMETIRPAARPPSAEFVDYVDGDRPKTQDWSFPSTKRKTQEWSFPSTNASNDNINNNHRNRKTREWKFPTSIPTSAPPDLDFFSDGDESDFPTATSYHYDRPATSQSYQTNRESALSLIDLDAGTVPYQHERPSTSQSYRPSRESTLSLIDLDASEVAYDGFTPSPPNSTPGSVAFDLELDEQSLEITTREPSLYIDDDLESIPSLTRQFSDLQSTPTTPDERPDVSWESSGLGILTDTNAEPQQYLQLTPQPIPQLPSFSSMPPLPNAPSPNILQGMGSQEDLKNELQYMIASLRDHLLYANDWLETYDTQDTEQGGAVYEATKDEEEVAHLI